MNIPQTRPELERLRDQIDGHLLRRSPDKVCRMYRVGHPPGVIATVTGLPRAEVIACLAEAGLREDH